MTVTGEDSPPERPGPETVVVQPAVVEGVQLTVTVLCVLERLKPGSAQGLGGVWVVAQAESLPRPLMLTV